MSSFQVCSDLTVLVTASENWRREAHVRVIPYHYHTVNQV